MKFKVGDIVELPDRAGGFDDSYGIISHEDPLRTIHIMVWGTDVTSVMCEYEIFRPDNFKLVYREEE